MKPEDNEWITAAVRYEDAYEVGTNSDLDEGRGRYVRVAVCPSYNQALAIAKGRGVMGSDAEVKETRLLRLKFNHMGHQEDQYLMSVFDINRLEGMVPGEVLREITVRQRALSKLTPEERKVLGIK